MIKPKESLSVVMVVVFGLIFWPIAVCILLEHLGKKDKRVFFDLEEDGSIDVSGDTLKVVQQEKKKESSRLAVVLVIAFMLLLILLLMMWGMQPGQAPRQVIFMPGQQVPPWQPHAPRAIAFELVAQFGQDGAKAANGPEGND
jgi:hypothetical protein